MIPREVQDELRRFFPASTPWGHITLTQEDLGKMAVVEVAMSVAPRAVMAVTLTSAMARAMQTVGYTIGRRIHLDRNYGKLDTAAGLALLAHEVVHVNQKEADPQFDEKYKVELRRTDPSAPWENIYELPAYTKECEVYYQKIAEGVPPGSWRPMGVTLNLCGER